MYSPEGDVSIKHKRSKWFDIAESLGLPNSSLGTFSYDKPWFTSVMSNNPDAKLQAAHTYIDTIYVHKGSTVNLSLPTQMSGNYSVHTYQRWYSYRTDGTFETNHSSGSAYDLLTPTSGSAYRLSNGYVGNPLGDKMTSMNFYYPEDDEFNSWFDNAASLIMTGMLLLVMSLVIQIFGRSTLGHRMMLMFQMPPCLRDLVVMDIMSQR